MVSGTSCNDLSGKSRIDRSDIKSFVVVFKLKLLFSSFTSQHGVRSESLSYVLGRLEKYLTPSGLSGQPIEQGKLFTVAAIPDHLSLRDASA